MEETDPTGHQAPCRIPMGKQVVPVARAAEAEMEGQTVMSGAAGIPGTGGPAANNGQPGLDGVTYLSLSSA